MIKFNAYKQKPWLLRLFDRKPDSFELPTQWSELTQRQFAAIASVIFDYMGKVDITELRLRIVQALSGYERSKKGFSPDDAEQINCNLYILSQFIRFPFKTIFTNPEIIEGLSTQLKAELKKHFLFEIYHPELKEEIAKYGNLLAYKLDLKLNLTSNLIPSININGVTYYGPMFNIDANGILDTDLLAGEWIEANEYMQLIAQTKTTEYMAHIAACLYRTNRKNYDPYESKKLIAVFKQASESELKAVWLMLKAIQQYVCTYPKYEVLFTQPENIEDETDNNKIKADSSDIFYQLSKDGFGTFAEVMNLPVFDFLNIQIKNIREAISSLRGHKQTNKQIAQTLKMDIETVLKF